MHREFLVLRGRIYVNRKQIEKLANNKKEQDYYNNFNLKGEELKWVK